MAEPQMETHHTNPRNNSFLCCFGFSGEKKPPEKTIQSSGNKKSSSLLSWPMFRLRVRKFRTKTVPVDNNEKAKDDSKSHTPKLIKKRSEPKLSSKPQSPTNHKPPHQNPKADQPLPSSNQAARKRPKETRLKGPEQKIILGNTKPLEPTRSGSSLPGSPIIKQKPEPKANSKLTHTVSLPAIQGKLRVGNPRIHGQTNLKELRRKNKEVVEKFDPVMGMSILMVTLIIMLLWGRLCAILCTSAWFYFYRRFRATNYNNETTANSNNLYLNSKEYKKKVVLEGLLQRNRPITL